MFLFVKRASKRWKEGTKFKEMYFTKPWNEFITKNLVAQNDLTQCICSIDRYHKNS